MRGQIVDHYTVLGIDRDAPKSVIKTIYYKLMSKVHPDKTLHLPEAEREKLGELTKKYNCAWEVLQDDNKRQAHDKDLPPSNLFTQSSRQPPPPPPRASTPQYSPESPPRASKERYSPRSPLRASAWKDAPPPPKNPPPRKVEESGQDRPRMTTGRYTGYWHGAVYGATTPNYRPMPQDPNALTQGSRPEETPVSENPFMFTNQKAQPRTYSEYNGRDSCRADPASYKPREDTAFPPRPALTGHAMSTGGFPSNTPRFRATSTPNAPQFGATSTPNAPKFGDSSSHTAGKFGSTSSQSSFNFGTASAHNPKPHKPEAAETKENEFDWGSGVPQPEVQAKAGTKRGCDQEEQVDRSAKRSKPEPPSSKRSCDQSEPEKPRKRPRTADPRPPQPQGSARQQPKPTTAPSQPPPDPAPSPKKTLSQPQKATCEDVPEESEVLKKVETESKREAPQSAPAAPAVRKVLAAKVPATKAPATKAPVTKAPATKAPATKAPAPKVEVSKAEVPKPKIATTPAKEEEALKPEYSEAIISEGRPNEFDITIQSWHFKIKFSKKYQVVGKIDDETPKDLYDVTATVVIKLKEAKQDSKRDSGVEIAEVEGEKDVQIVILACPGNREISAVNSLLKYTVDLDGTGGNASLHLTLQSLKKAPLRTDISVSTLAFDLSISHELPDSAKFIGVYKIFSVKEPPVKYRDGSPLKSYSPIRPEYRLQERFPELQPVHLLHLKDDYYTKVESAGGKWYVMAAVGFKIEGKEDKTGSGLHRSTAVGVTG